MIDPNRDLRRAAAEVEISGNVDARRRLADELLERDQFSEAIEVYRGGLKGIFEFDPTLLLGLARAQFGNQDFADARTTLETLRQQNPDFKSADANLLYARVLESQDARKKRNANMPRPLPAFQVRKPSSDTVCCSSAAASCKKRAPSSRICWMARSLGPRTTVAPRENGWSGRGANWFKMAS